MLQRCKARWDRLGLGWLAAGTVVALLGGGLVWAQIFGLGDYPGGQLRTVYRITGEDDPTPATYTLEITPEGEVFRVRTVFESREAQEDIDVGVFGFGFGFRPEERIDLTPLSALDEREVEPGKSLVLPGGARLQTQEATEIAGVPVVMAVYTHPDFPDQRAIVAIPDVETRRLLVFPPLVRVERQEGEGFKVISRIELIEFAREP